MAIACNCAYCSTRRVTPGLVLIALGAIFLAHMAIASFNTAAMIGTFLAFIGALNLTYYFLPRAAAGPHGGRGSIFVPLLLLTIGVLILVRHSLPQAPVGAWIASYWPLLLILWGIVRLVEHYTLPPRARSGMSGGEILLVILIVVFGLAFSGMYRFGHSRWANYWGVNVEGWNPFLQSFDYTTSTQLDLPASATSVVIRGFRGDVTLVPGAPGKVSAALDDTVHADGESSGRGIFNAAQPQVRVEGDQILVLPVGEGAPGNIRADLKLTLPASLPVTIALERGDISVPNWGAPLTIRTAHGSVTASNVKGNVEITSGHNDVSLDQITGSVSVSGSGGDVSITNVTGDVRLQGEFTGSLNFRNLPRGLEFNSDRTALSLAALPGSIRYDMGQINVQGVQALQLRTRNEEIVVNDFTGPLTVSDRNEPVTASTATAPTQPIQLSTRDADITLTLPASSRITTTSVSRNGNVRNDFNDAPGGVPVTLQTSNGTISVRKP